jgi:mannosyltransferase OCH1-like enzyme
MIPKILHYIWVGPPMPDHLVKCIETWKPLHPEWEIMKWTDDNLDWISHRSWFDIAPKLVGPNEVGQLRADIARLEILWKFGGVYIDCDLEALKPIDELCKKVTGFAGFEDPESLWVNNAIVGAEPENDFIGYLLDGLHERLRYCQRHNLRRPSIMTGPQWITPLWQEHGQDFKIYPHWYFYPYAHNELDRYGESFPDSYTIHHWHHQRTIRNRRI